MLAICSALAFNLVPLLQPTNEMSYNAAEFYNSALGIFVGCAVAPLSFLLLPPLSPAFRTKRLLRLTLRDLRRLAINHLSVSAEDWQGRTHSRLVVLPDQAEPLQRAQLLAALLVGTEIIHLRAMRGLDSEPEFDSALRILAKGNCAAVIAQLTALDHRLPSIEQADGLLVTRARGSILAICDALADHHAYFDAGASA
jgi:uncharacterized membrane protein YccC